MDRIYTAYKVTKIGNIYLGLTHGENENIAKKLAIAQFLDVSFRGIIKLVLWDR